MTNMKITLAEKPKLIPSTPPLPATLEGSLQPSHAITAGAFAKTAPINEARTNRMTATCAISSCRAIDKPKKQVMERWEGWPEGIARRDRGLAMPNRLSSVRSGIFIAIVYENGASSGRSDIEAQCLPR